MSARNLRKLYRPILLAVFGASLGLGCELIVDFDRTKIPGDDSGAPTGDASPFDATVNDTGATDSGVDSSVQDTGTDSGPDAADAADGD